MTVQPIRITKTTDYKIDIDGDFLLLTVPKGRVGLRMNRALAQRMADDVLLVLATFAQLELTDDNAVDFDLLGQTLGS